MSDRKARAELERQLVWIEGQILGVRKMVTEGRGDVDVLMQVAAVRAALKQVGDTLVVHHIDNWIANAPRITGSPEERADELLKIFRQYYR